MKNILANKFYSMIILLAVLAVAFLLTFVGGVMASYVSANQVDDPANVAPAAIPQISKNLTAELNTAMNPDYPFSFAQANNPFQDLSGLSSKVSNSNSASIPSNTFNGVTSNNRNLPKSLNYNRVPSEVYPSVQPTPPLSEISLPKNPANTVEYPVSSYSAEDRLKARRRAKRLGEKVGSLSEIFEVDDVRPYGIVGSGKVNRVKLYSISTKERFSVFVGAKFLDGEVTGVTGEGVSFVKDSGEVVFHRWFKNTNELQQTKEKPRVDAPIIELKP